MPSLRTVLRGGNGSSTRSLGIDDLAELLKFQGQQYLLTAGRVGSYRREEVRIGGEDVALSTSGAVFAAVGRRMDLFSQVSFAWKRLGAAPRPMASDLFTTAALAPLDDPGELLTWMELDQALAGNSFVVRDGDSLRRLVPWWVHVVLGSESQPEHPETAWDARPIGYAYVPPGGPQEQWLPNEVAHYYGRPDPAARWRGMSYLRPILRNVGNVEAAERYISQFYANATVPQTWITFPESKTPEEVEAFADLFEERHAGVANAFRTAYVGGGADPEVIGSKLSDLSAKEISATEFSSICNACGVPVVVVGIIPGLENAATYANYQPALRAFADLTIRPAWLKATRALAKLLPAPRGATLWYDTQGISALQADAKDDAEVLEIQARTISIFVKDGWDPEQAQRAVLTGNLGTAKHSGLVSVQLQPPGSGAEPSPRTPQPALPAGEENGQPDNAGQAT